MGDALKCLSSGIETGPLLGAVNAKPYLWDQLTARQDTEGSPHRETKTIFLRWAEKRDVASAFLEIPAVDYPALEELPEAIPLIECVMREARATALGRVILTSLRPDGSITPHADEGAYADYYERFHVPLASSIGALFFVMTGEIYGEFASMRPGDLWWFNHKEPHWVKNASDSARIHLIVDCASPEFRRERH